MNAIYTKADLEHCNAKILECEAKGNAARPGSATRKEWFDAARKWEATAERVRAALR